MKILNLKYQISRVAKNYNFFNFLSIFSLAATETSHETIWRYPRLHILQNRALKNHCITTLLPSSFRGSKLRSIDSNETILDGTAIMCDLFGREWL